jgi:DNA-binding MarR family transcriptional regulator
MGAQVSRQLTKKKFRERKPASSEVREVLNSLRRIVRSLRVASRTAEQRVGLSGAQLFVLQCLSRQSPCSVNELARRTATDQSSVSVVVSRLVAAGHVRRSVSKVDRRRVELTLSRSGRDLVESAPQMAQDRLLVALEQLPKASRQTLSKLLTLVVENAEVAEVAPALFFEDAPTLVRPKGSRRDG